MENALIKECEVSKKYVKKDGTVSTHKYKIKYAVVNKENKITQKKIIDEVKRIKKVDYEAFYNYIKAFNGAADNGEL